MTDDSLISIVMPAYNASKTIEMAIESVLAQSYPEFEMIVVDDCSTDDTARIVRDCAERDSRVKLLENVENSGTSISRRRGAEAAAGRWIAFLDSDDAWDRHKLEKQIAVRERCGAQLVFTGSAYMDAEGRPIDWRLHVPERVSYQKLLRQNLISNSSVLIRKDAYQRCSVIGDHMHEDYACWLRFLYEGNVAYGIDEPLLIYRLSSTSKSGNKLKAVRMNWNTYREIGLGPVSAAYYMLWYAVNGIKKYRSIGQHKHRRYACV